MKSHIFEASFKIKETDKREKEKKIIPVASFL